jgi:hypothetical protein
MAVTINGTTGVAVPLGSASSPAETNTTSATTGIYYPTSTTLGLSTNGTNAVTIDASQNVGIGTTSPSAPVSVSKDGAPAASGNMNTGLYVGANGSYAINIGGNATGQYAWINSAFQNNSGVAAPLVLMTGATERMRIDSSGNLLVGTTSAIGGNNSYMHVANIDSGKGGITVGNTTGSLTTTCIQFRNINGSVGSIVTSGSATGYNTSSDYRLKENVTPMTVGLATISALKPVTYDWKIDGSFGEGFIAHELQEIIPHAVTGQKDATNDDGSIKSQGVDYSKIVVHLVKAIQELSAEVEALKAKVGA